MHRFAPQGLYFEENDWASSSDSIDRQKPYVAEEFSALERGLMCIRLAFQSFCLYFCETDIADNTSRKQIFS
jgi:hypothetical protein